MDPAERRGNCGGLAGELRRPSRTLKQKASGVEVSGVLSGWRLGYARDSPQFLGRGSSRDKARFSFTLHIIKCLVFQSIFMRIILVKTIYNCNQNCLKSS